MQNSRCCWKKRGDAFCEDCESVVVSAAQGCRGTKSSL